MAQGGSFLRRSNLTAVCFNLLTWQIYTYISKYVHIPTRKNRTSGFVVVIFSKAKKIEYHKPVVRQHSAYHTSSGMERQGYSHIQDQGIEANSRIIDSVAIKMLVEYASTHRDD